VPSIFTRIIDGELPARFVWRDDTSVAFLPLELLNRGHVLVVPRLEVDHWIDLPPDVVAHLATVSQTIGRAQQQAFSPVRIGMLIVGFDVPHVHLHVVPVDNLSHFDFHAADRHPDPDDLDRTAETLRATLRTLGHSAHVPD